MLNQADADDGRASPESRRFDSVVILEDDGLLSLMMEDLVREHGATKVHVFRDTASALCFLEHGQVDCAILDVTLHGGVTYAVADRLVERDIPFLFCSGLRASDLEERHQERPLLAKPYSDDDFRDCLARALAR